ncbi:TetR/AcrR family transcriptional regulator [Microbacterium excoecariae]|uniref:TetR/AcrR family transcriptional regulator n=1 Tax=Microbacterium excoecariae TaxID=2715210 RepID=UPI001408AC38|nr:TetR/AcrR family transcriptional regulator [Microbacterium excoecariae]NHI17413.1 TetR/AcrR family transcriptional regulator [Microbacterium excoecariae]
MASEDAVIGRQGSYAKGVARRREILDRAIEVFAERGADGTSLRRIAQAIGVSHAALLHYFDSREQLLVAVYEHAEARRAAGEDDPRPGHAIDLIVGAAVSNLRVPGLVELYTTLVAASLEAGSEAGKAHFTQRFERVRADLAERLRADQAAGIVRADIDPEPIAALIVAASDGLQIQWLLDPSISLQETLGAFAALLHP